ncbi:hypothetical protein [Maledivibacter halophilus]|uniref:Uncharacterized protein n=1 Tax=Maledivibacter halophilus TaxID=36842 RepID=A0A1T5LW28_9FIRM|nr:hypothetical protein [Maledivibacter halophilus]SKC68254.1 hypothetical protein SAMN02194393_02132 [Maledivibacter halophilus]SKC71845.1 hypothetical protein SAMN02194393_02520 [Maledivibacter halophilus]SKC80152.1 hypothetical protein SAMN02194393_03443 [Maledivibacter halophilus]
MLTFTLYLLLGILCICVGVIVPFFILMAIFCTPYWFYLGMYKEQHNLSKDFRKTNSVFKEIKYAAIFYGQIIRFKKPTFD